MRAQDEEAERERDVRGDDDDGAAARVGRERAPGAGDAGGEEWRPRSPPSPWRPWRRAAATSEPSAARAARRATGDGARGGGEGEQLKDQRQLIADGGGVGDRLDVYRPERPQRRGGERGRAIAGDDAQEERGDERDGDGVEREVGDAERQRPRAERGDHGRAWRRCGSGDTTAR